MLFFFIQQAPGSNFRKVRKFLFGLFTTTLRGFIVWMNSVDPDDLDSKEANLFGSVYTFQKGVH